VAAARENQIVCRWRRPRREGRASFTAAKITIRNE